MTAPFGRNLTAMVTPFTAGGDLDLDAAQRVATHLVDAGNDGLVISGTTGESPTTTDAEKEALIRAVVAAVGDRAIVVAGSGTNDTRHAAELSQQAEKAGAHGLLVVTPVLQQASAGGTARAFPHGGRLDLAAGDAVRHPGPYRYRDRHRDPVQLAAHERILAVKDAKNDIAATTEVLARTDLAYYSGADEWNLALLAAGAVGVVSVVGHAAAGDYAAMIRAVDEGDLATARTIDRRLVPAYQAIMTRTQGAIMAKAALEVLGVLTTRAVRPPLVPATDEQIRQLTADLREAGLTS